MSHPDSQQARDNREALPKSIPVERLIESQTPEKPLITDQSFLPAAAVGGSGGSTPQ
jgi:hypothetical protein